MSTADELMKLAQLRADGLLTESEFQEQKRIVLGQPPAVPGPLELPECRPEDCRGPRRGNESPQLRGAGHYQRRISGSMVRDRRGGHDGARQLSALDVDTRTNEERFQLGANMSFSIDGPIAILWASSQPPSG